MRVPTCTITETLEAFENRGQADFLGSHDMEDIITVIDGRSEIVDDISISDDLIQSHLTVSFKIN